MASMCSQEVAVGSGAGDWGQTGWQEKRLLQNAEGQVTGRKEVKDGSLLECHRWGSVLEVLLPSKA